MASPDLDHVVGDYTKSWRYLAGCLHNTAYGNIGRTQKGKPVKPESALAHCLLDEALELQGNFAGNRSSGSLQQKC